MTQALSCSDTMMRALPAMRGMPTPGRSSPLLPTTALCRLGLVAAGIGAVLGLLVHFRVLDGAKLMMAMDVLDVRLMLVVVGLSVVSNGLRVLRWHLLTREIAPQVPLTATVAYMLTGFAFLLTPGKVGEVVRIWLLKTRQDVPYTRSLGLLLLDRMVDMVCLMLLAGAGVIAANSGDASLVSGLLAVLVLPIMLLASRRVVVCAVRAGYRASGRRWPGMFVFVLATDRSVRSVSRPGLLIAAIALGLAAWAAQIAGIWLVLGAFGYHGSLLQAAVLYPTALLLGAAAVMPGGADAVMLGMLAMAGMTAEVAIAATLVSRIFTWWLAMLVGFCVAPFVLAGGIQPST